jgi:ribosomal-protein-alanine acetyltransferase
VAVFQSLRNLFFFSPAAEEEIIVPAPPTTYSINPVSHQNLPEIVRLNLRCFRNGENYSKHTFNYLMNEPQSLSYRAVTAEGKIAGIVFVVVNPNGAAHITTLCVAPEHRRRGVAVMLLEHLHAMLIEKGITTVVLEVRVSNLSAQSLYKSAGYSVLQRVVKYYNNGEDGYLMLRSLN